MELTSEYLKALIALAVLHLAAAISPGPSVILVAHTAAFKSRSAGLAAACAMGVGATVWAASALFGFQILLMEYPGTLRFLGVLGAVFLMWIGFKIARSAKEPLIAPSGTESSDQNFSKALKLQLSNPKVVIFFSSIFLTSLPVDAPLWFKTLILCVIFVDETLWYALLAYLLSTTAAQNKFIRWKSWIGLVCGILLSLMGLKLLIEWIGGGN